MMMQQVLHSASAVRFLGVSCAVLLGVTTARAEPTAPPQSPPPGVLTIDGLPGRRLTVDTPVNRRANPYATISQIILLERCTDSCTVYLGGNDARTNSSTIPKQAMSTVSEFKSGAGLTGAAADAEWTQVVQCMKEVYSPYNVIVTDVPPAPGLTYHKAIIAGSPAEIQLPSNILGVAPLASDCSPIDNVLSFTFANVHPTNPAQPLERILNLCWTAAQESAHAFGLDHEFSFSGNRSACNDPMTYRNDCGGQKFFRNEIASCGEDAARPCKCGANQNSHLKIVQVFGAGTPITGNPTSTITSPAVGGGLLDRVVTVEAGSKRGIARVELLFNGYKWTEVAGAAFGRQGQPNPGDYTIVIPTTLPNSIVDIVAIAYDDLGASTQSGMITSTRGEACQSAASCAAGQKCEAGKCFWDPPAGELGDSCTYPQFCKSGLCRGTKDEQICTHECLPYVTDSCESGFECVPAENSGVCFFPASGGCCSVDRSGRGWLAHAALAIIVLGFVLRRRRR